MFLGSAGESFALPACPSSGFFHNCFGTWTFDNGDKYVGEWRNDKKNRHSTSTCAEGRVVEGVWNNGELVEKSASLPTCVSDADDLSDCVGTNTWADGTKCVGEQGVLRNGSSS